MENIFIVSEDQANAAYRKAQDLLAFWFNY